MADVVRTGAIFRVKNPATMRSPMPRLTARSRMASATPEPPTPTATTNATGASRATTKSALERVVSRGAPVLAPQQQRQQLKVVRKQSKSLPHKQQQSKKVKRMVTSPAKGQGVEASVLVNFNRVVRENETRRASMDSKSSNQTVADATTETVRKGRKRPRVEPDEEPTEELDSEEEESVGEEKEDEEDEKDDDAGSSSSDNAMETPQRTLQRDAQQENTDDDGVQVQKRLMYDDTPPAKTNPAKDKSTSTVSVVETPVMVVPATLQNSRSRVPPKKAAKKPLLKSKSVAVGGSGLELLSLSSAGTPSRSTRIRTGVLVMSEWYPEWPPQFVGDQLQLTIHGHVLGQRTAYSVQRRVSDSQFVSTDNHNVRLDGCIDIDRAQEANVPAIVMGILVEGIPPQWRQRLESYAPPPDPWMPVSTKAKEKAKIRKARAAEQAEAQAKAKADAEAEAEAAKEQQRQSKTSRVSLPGAAKVTAKPRKKTSSTVSTAPSAATQLLATPEPEKRSRSGRRITPVMEWWRNERKLTDANFETKILTGSPAYLPSKRTTPTKMSVAAQAARQKIQELYDLQRKSAEWSDEQLKALHDAKLQVQTKHPRFWAEVASRVAGKSADECRAKTFDDMAIVPTRKAHAAHSKAAAGATSKPGPSAKASAVPVKIHRAGSNLFKKQVRQFVHDQEQKHEDDLFSMSTPSKDAFAGTAGLDDLHSPGAPLVDKHAHGDGDNSDDDAGGRELLEKVSLSKRDDVDSYVRTLKRGNDGLSLKAVRMNKAASCIAGFTTPQAKKKPRREGVHMETEVGGRVIEAIVTPSGTTRVRISKGSDVDEDEDEDEEEEEEREEAVLSDDY